MKIEIAEYAGFCMGVDLALKKLDKALESVSSCEETVVATIGPIIHNPQVLKEYEEKHVKILTHVSEIEPHMHVIIRAHGITKEEEEEARRRAMQVVDATCPKVKAAQISVSNATQKISEEAKYDDCMLLLYGEEEHPEVRGILSYSKIPYLVFSNEEEIFSQLVSFPQNLIIASQTTQDKDLFNEFCEKLKALHKGNIIILDTICDATKQRQEAVRELAASVDAMIVVGGKQSGNTRRLAEISLSYGIPTYHIETIEELSKEKLELDNTYGLTAGASTPKKYMYKVKSYLEELE